jgi:hypothetical protein
MKQAEADAIRAKLTPLLNLPHFGDWMEGIVASSNAVLSEFGNYQTVADERVTTAAIAEFGVYDDLVAAYTEAHPEWLDSLDEPRPDDDRERRIRGSWELLIQDGNFRELMGAIREEIRRETSALRRAKTASVQLAAIGRITAYSAIAATFRAHMQAIENGLAEEKHQEN